MRQNKMWLVNCDISHISTPIPFRPGSVQATQISGRNGKGEGEEEEGSAGQGEGFCFGVGLTTGRSATGV